MVPRTEELEGQKGLPPLTKHLLLGPEVEHSDLAALGQLLVHAVQQRHHEGGVAPAADQHVLRSSSSLSSAMSRGTPQSGAS